MFLLLKNFSSRMLRITKIISALMWTKNVQLQTNIFRSNQRRRPIESILLLMQIGGKICPAPMHIYFRSKNAKCSTHMIKPIE
ncbi:hypothetical protein T02_15457 [Trichinella nativa]|uniref:Uncharacterized protein n=1 Tax=Trichinella nativa TaxID=6335 RepID=A0A0V1LLI3_9BILA|nr:hypothetical protein T02_15457 [Trichinella nativa]